MDISKKNIVMVSNRGPNFISGSKLHRGMGGTKEIYARLMEKFCKAWICLASSDLESHKVNSSFGKNLEILFVNKNIYNNYYYKYVSEFLYPTLLGFPEKAVKKHKSTAFKQVTNALVDKIRNEFKDSDILICDYHLYMIPELIDWNCRKIFLWFIPFLSRKYYSPQLKEIVKALNECDELYVFNDVWVQNFKEAFYWYYPNQTLKVNVKSIIMGPDEAYSDIASIKEKDFIDLLLVKLNIQHQTYKRYIISASRMDFVKNIPLLIQGFDKYLIDNPEDKNTELILIAPHHRKGSNLYEQEELLIKKLVDSSEHKIRIHLTHDYFNAEELRILFKFCNLFVCSSRFDAMPLTPLEYILANNGSGGVAICKELGSQRLLFPNCISFENNNKKSLARALELFFKMKVSERENRMRYMKKIANNVILENSMNEFELNLKKL